MRWGASTQLIPLAMRTQSTGLDGTPYALYFSSAFCFDRARVALSRCSHRILEQKPIFEVEGLESSGSPMTTAVLNGTNGNMFCAYFVV